MAIPTRVRPFATQADAVAAVDVTKSMNARNVKEQIDGRLADETTPDADTVKLSTPADVVRRVIDNGELALFTPTAPVLGNFTIVNYVNRTVFVEREYRSADLGKMGPALNRALARSEVKKIEFGSDAYSFDDTVSINRGDIAIVGPGMSLGALNLTGTSALLFDIGASTGQLYTVQLSGLAFTRSLAAAGSAVIRLRNTSYFELDKSRFYMDNKFGHALNIYGGIYHKYADLLSDNPIDHHVTVAGGPNAGGVADGWVVEHTWRDSKFTGGNAGKASPQAQASFIMNDHVSASWMRDLSCYGHLGAFIDMRGTLANRSRNILNLFHNINVEATFDNSCSIRVDSYSGCGVGGTDAWLSGKGMPAIICTANSQDNTFAKMQIGVIGSDGISDAGKQNIFDDPRIVGYSSGAAGIRFLSGSENGIVNDGKITQVTNGIVNEAGGSAGHIVRGKPTFGASVTPFVGFNVQGTNKVDGYLKQDSAPFVARTSPTLDLPIGCGDVTIRVFSGTGDIDSFRPGVAVAERVTVNFGSVGLILRDINLSGGNIVLRTSMLTITTTDERLVMTFEWDGTYWRAIYLN